MPNGETEPPTETSQAGLNGSIGANCPSATVRKEPGNGNSTFALRFSVPPSANGIGMRNFSAPHTELITGMLLSVALSNPEGLMLAPNTRPFFVIDMWAPATGGPNGMPSTI